MADMNIDKRGTGRFGNDEPTRRTLRRRDEGPSYWSPWSLMSMNPFALMRQFSEDMDRNLPGAPSWSRGSDSWSPAVDVSERDGAMVIRADLPGLSPEDVNIEITPEGLVIQGERKREHEERGAWGYRSERSYGSFYRSIPLPDNAKIDEAKAEFQNGVLEVTVPMDEQRQRRRQIPIAGHSGERKPAVSETPVQKPEARAR
jgi:HSP20 family protein